MRRKEPYPFHRELPIERSHALLSRTDPAVEAIARYVLDAALDPTFPEGQRPARRAGVIRTSAVSTRTSILLVRFRFHAELPLSDGTIRPLVVEDARLLGFSGSPESAVWLSSADVEKIANAEAEANVAADLAVAAAGRVLDGLGALTKTLNKMADDLAGELLESHRRARAGAGAARRGLKVTAQKPVDILGAYVFLPISAGAE